ncbi:aquaporin-11-like [Hyperolius riggenbachi]|uniref:aquaporin-11-like n=1 Tax=Hyperolius riggenbachi TaxID=752182 RepID=UPI0035A2D6B2
MDITELVLGSAALIIYTVFLCELLRWVCRRALPAGLGLDLALEVVCTVQLCCCTLEVDLLCTRTDAELWLALTLTYLLTVVHCTTFGSATCNPCGSMNQWLYGKVKASRAVLQVVAQFVAAGLSWVLMPHLWSLGVSPLHKMDKDCYSPLQVSYLTGALVEMACALSLFLTLQPLPRISEALQPHMIAVTITLIAYAGATLTGALFNPVLAFAVVFLCQGNTYLEYIFVYWIGPLIGTFISFLLLKYILPKFRPGQMKMD